MWFTVCIATARCRRNNNFAGYSPPSNDKEVEPVVAGSLFGRNAEPVTVALQKSRVSPFLRLIDMS
jgi:hypothetical protein